MPPFDYTLEGPIGTRATLALVVLQSDETIEHDFRRIFAAPDISLYVTRVPSGLDVTTDTLATMSAALPAAARLLPTALKYDVVGYGCTSGTAVIGPDKIAEQIKAGCDAAQVTEPLSALVAICRDRGISRIAFLSPYIESVSATLREALNARGIETPVFGSFDEGEETKVAKISQQSLYDAALALGTSDEVDAVFMSCTNLRTLDVIPRIEATLGKPVFSSNQVLAWHMAKLAGVALTQPR
ncbi:MAG: maleate cis-trans isomerase family protein [Sulfitobacter sp.]